MIMGFNVIKCIKRGINMGEDKLEMVLINKIKEARSYIGSKDYAKQRKYF